MSNELYSALLGGGAAVVMALTIDAAQAYSLHRGIRQKQREMTAGDFKNYLKSSEWLPPHNFLPFMRTAVGHYERIAKA